MRSRRALVGGAVAALALAVALPASAYSLTGAFWTWQDHPVEDPFALAVGDFPADAGDTGEIEDAFTNAMADWNGVGRDVALTYGGVVEDAVLDFDGFPIIQYGSYSGMGAALAFAGTWAYDDGAAFDCDLVVLSANDYGAIYWDADPAGPASGRYDLQAVALHELGHCLGLNHSDSSSAVMYAYYGGLRALSNDDTSGLAALYAPACADADGDGAFGCDFDCDDTNALVHPGATEVCDGVDGDCDGIVDATATETLTIGDTGREVDSAWLGGGNVYQVDAPTALVSARAYMSVQEGTRLVWSVYASTDAGVTWSRIRTELAFATADTWQESPKLHQPLTVGTWYAVSLGAYADALTVKVDWSPDLEPTGLVTPLGYVYGRPMADDLGALDASYLYHQELTLVSAADPDGDGLTALCGDCAPDDATAGIGASEVCDGVDNDCDGSIDEDFGSDGDGDGTIDCLDACPADPLDDVDGDGACADVDPCPEDAADTCDDPVDTADTSDTPSIAPPGETPGGCGCDGSGTPAGLVGVLGIAAVFGRRRGRQARLRG